MVRKMNWKSTIGPVLCALLFVAGCGNSPGATSAQNASPPAQGASASQTATVDVIVSWPSGKAKPSLFSFGKQAQKVLAASSSFSVIVTAPDINVPITGSSNLSLASASSLSLSIPIGNARKFEARVYDGQNGTGNIIAYATTTADILPGANTVSMGFAEVPRSIALPASPVVGVGSGQTLTFGAKDSDGYAITNNALVAWSVVGGNANGTIANGVYTPPANYPGTGSNMTVTIQAASALDTTAPAISATLTLNATSSGTVNFSVGTVVPTGVSASAGNGQATVSWNVTGGATSYKVYYGTTSGVDANSLTFVSGVTNTYTTVTGLTNGTTYYFVVVAVNATSQTGISSQVSATPAVPPVSIPTGLFTISGDTQITLNWSAVANAASYNVYWSTTSGAGTGGTKVPVTSGTSYTHTGLTNGTTYHFVVTAVNAGGESSVSSQISAIPYSLIAIVQVAIGGGHTVVLKGDGSVWAWGYNYHGQLGDNTGTARTSPVQVKGLNGVGYLTGVVAVAAGTNHTVALKADGTVLAWGLNSSGELGEGTTVNRIVPSQVWGDAGAGSYLTGVTAVFAGNNHNVVMKSDGSVWAWGYNGQGQLGDGSVTARTLPVRVKGVGGSGFLSGVSGIVAGSNRTFALKPDGTALMWGENYHGCVGTGAGYNDYSTPVTVGFSGIVSLATGANHVVAVKSDGSVWAWGYNGYGELGDRTTTNRWTPAQVAAASGASGYLTGVRSVSAGPNFSVAYKNDGTVYAWGRNYTGQLGDNTVTTKTWPVQVLGSGGVGNLAGVTSVIAAANEDTVFALKDDNTLWGWGYNLNGEYGNATATTSYTPMQSLTANTSALPAPSGVAASANAATSSITVTWPTVALASSYNLYWSTSPGVNALRGTKVAGANPVGTTVSGLASATTYYFTVTAVNNGGESAASAAVSGGLISSAPGGVSAAPTDGGITLSWTAVAGAHSYNVYWSTTSGAGTAGTKASVASGTSYTHTGLTNGTPYYYVVTAVFNGTDSPASSQASATPTQLSIVQVAIGGGHTVVLKGDGSVWAWGYNYYGQLGDNTGTARTSPVQVKGLNGVGYLTGVVAVAAGTNHTVALKADGTVLAWGLNSSGELGEGTTVNRIVPSQVWGDAGAGSYLTGVTAVFAGNNHNVVMKSDGSVWAWGYNGQGQLGDGSVTVRTLPVRVKGVGGSGFLSGVSGIVAGSNRTFALKPDGTALMWGENYHGCVGTGAGYNDYSTPVTVGFSGIVSLATGANHVVAVKSDGSVWAWGYNGYGELGDRTTTNRWTPAQVAAAGGASGYLTGVRSVSAGPNFSVAYKNDGTVYAWGRNNAGQLGDNTVTTRTWPVQVLGSGGVGNLAGVTSVIAAANEDTVFALKDDNTLWGWGYNLNGEYGNATATTSYTPMQSQATNIASLLAPSGVAASANASASSITVTWPAVSGASSYNLYWSTRPDVNTINGAKVTNVTSGHTLSALSGATTYYFIVTAVNAGGESAASAAVSGGLISSAPSGVSATPTDSVNTMSWTPVAGAHSYNVYWSTTSGAGMGGTKVSVASGTSYTHTGLTNGTPYYYVVTAVFNGTDSPASSQASATPTQLSIVQVAIGGGHTVVLKGDGSVWAWGLNNYGQLGDNTTTTRTSPVQVKGVGGGGYLTGVVAVAAGTNYTLALKGDGTVWGWGVNTEGELGDNTSVTRYTPVQVFGSGGVGYLSGVSAIFAGNGHSVAMKTDGTVWAWGYNAHGQLGDGTTVNKFYPVQVKGLNGVGFLSGVATIVPGYNLTFALKPDGTAPLAWGYNGYGVLGDGSTTTRTTPVVGGIAGIVSLAVSDNHALAVKSDGSVWAWGLNNYGQLGDRTTINRTIAAQVTGTTGGASLLTGMTAVAAGGDWSFALQSDGTVYAWGRNNFGQLGDNTITTSTWPVQVLGNGGTGNLTGVSSIIAVASESTTFALKNDNTLWGWGYNGNGEYGNATATTSYTPMLSPASIQSALLAPSAVAATAGGAGQITPSWTASAGATSYNVYWSTRQDVNTFNGTKVAGAVSGNSISGLTAGTRYYLVVTAVSAAGESSASVVASAVAP